MKKALTIFLGTVLFLGFFSKSFAQERYVDSVFSGVTVTDSVVYGLNYSILPAFLGLTTDTIQVPLFMDIYQPTGDTETERPLILFGITGTFFPAIVNGGFTGERKDIAVVDFATRMAKKGYVVAVVQYRRGWNPLGPAIVQQRTILHAAYRGIQDMRNVVRAFKANVEGMADFNLDGTPEPANLFGIDTSRIAVGGTGTGGYMSYGATYLKRYEQTLLNKFIDFTDPANPVPFLDTLIFGDPYGINPGTINRPNYPTYSSDFKMGFALQGALGAREWVEEGDVPFVAMHSERDPGAPYNVGDIIAVDGTTNPPSPFAVIPEGSGALGTLSKADSLGNQSIFESVTWRNPIVQAGYAKNGGVAGLFPFDTPYTPGDAMCLGTAVPGDTLQEWGSPWNLFNEAVAEATWNTVFASQIMAGTQINGATAVCINKRGFPNDFAVGEAYMDTIEAFITSHLAIGLDLGTSVSVDPIIEDENVEVFPNPAKSFFTIQYRDGIKNIEAVKLLDLNGRTVRNYTGLNSIEFQLQRNELTPGLYILQVSLPDGVVNKKILFE